MKKSLLEISAFFVVLLLGMVGIAFMGGPSDSQVFYLSAPTKQVTGDTIIIGDLSIGEPLGADIPALTGTHLESFKERRIHTQEGLTRYRQVLRLSKTGSFNGASIQHVRSKRDDKVGDFLVFQSDEPAFEYEMVFNPGLESKVKDGKAEDFEDVTLYILGKKYALSKAEVRGDKVELEFFGASFLKIKDDMSDNMFSRGVEVNGRKIDARVKINGIAGPTRILISSITYQFFPTAKQGGDVFVEPRRGLTQYLREPQGMIHPGFNILYGGLSGAPVQQTTIRRPGGSLVHFDPRGDDSYRLRFTNTRGQTYIIPLAELQGSQVRLGDGKRNFIVKEGSNPTSFNIKENDYFIVSSSNKISGTTNILEMDEIDAINFRVFFNDLAGGQRIVNYNPTTGEGILPAGGANYKISVDLVNKNRIVVDQNNNGAFDGGKPKIIILGGAMLEISGSGSSVNMNFRTPARLFRDGGGNDEVVSFNIVKDGNELDLIVPTQSTLKLHKDKDRIRKGLTSFGVYFALDDNAEPAELFIEFPYRGGQRYAGVYATSGQAKGYVVITLELERFLPKK